jgi:putative nucleotidyltransferase with HDIG domain
MPFKLRFLTQPPPSPARNRRKITAFSLIMGLLFVLTSAYLLYNPQEKVIGDQSLQVGDIVKDDINIKKSLTVEDKESTQEKRRLAIENVVPVYEPYEETRNRSRNLITQWFQLIREARKEFIKNKKSSKELRRIKNEIENRLGLEFSQQEIRMILESRFFDKADLNHLLTFVSSLYDKKILTSLIGAQQSKDGSIHLVSKSSEREPVILNIAGLYDLKKAKTALTGYIKQHAPANEPPEFTASILMDFIKENISYSRILTRAEEQKAAAAVNPVLIKLKAGKVILRKGDEVKPEDAKILKLIAVEDKMRERKLSSFYLLIVILCFLTLFGMKFFNIWVSSGINKDKLLGVTGATLLVSIILYRASLFLFPLVLDNLSMDIHYDLYSIYYAVPFGLGALVIAFSFNLQSAVIFSIVNALIGGILCEWDFYIFLYILLGNLAASYGIEYYERLKRSPIIKASLLWLLPVNMITISIFQLTRTDFSLEYLSVSILLGTFSAVVSPILANFIIPIWESLFKLVTELKLIELTNLNLPIFREMLEKAPGTYHHSQMVASLSEAAAQDMGLSPLLLRSMALYHDIGKIDNPHFFTENHTIYKNPHDALSSRESAKNIISHIPDGLERAEKIKLPPIIQSAIYQHHGTKRVQYFYAKALEMSSIDSDGFDDSAFRYRGEKPQNIENAVTMLADQVEAASKSITSPTDEEIKNVIQQIIGHNIEEGQFDECEGLTFKALNTIASSLLRKLSSIYHMRVSYPGFNFKEKEKTNDSAQDRSATDRFKAASPN